MIKVFGHTAPDTDSTGSPIIWAWYLTHIKNTPAQAVLLGSPNSEAAFMLRHWGLDMPKIISKITPGDKVVIVDTNNPAELPKSIHDAQILNIIDHHMLVGGLNSKTPIDMTLRPLACTATIMHDLIGDDLAHAPRAIKGAMLSCILSDTLEFRSPTTTAHDRAVAEKLAQELDVNITDYANAMFEAKSDVSAYSDHDLLRVDSKQYVLGGHDLRISVLETTAPQLILARKEGLMNAMPKVAKEDGADQVLLFVIDIIREEAILFVPNDLVKAIAEKSFNVHITGDQVVLPGILSRKKQIIPALQP